MLVTTIENLTVAPGVVLGTFAVLTISSPATVTVVLQRLSLLPVAQLVPRVVELTVLASTLLPVSGSFTVTE